MLTLKIRIIIIVIMLLALLYIINLIKKKSLELRYALIWLISGFIVIILSIFPKLIKLIASFIGVYSPVNTLFFLGFCFSLAILFSLTIFASRSSIRIKKLTQEIAIKNDEILKLINQSQSTSSKVEKVNKNKTTKKSTSSKKKKA